MTMEDLNDFSRESGEVFELLEFETVSLLKYSGESQSRLSLDVHFSSQNGKSFQRNIQTNPRRK